MALTETFRFYRKVFLKYAMLAILGLVAFQLLVPARREQTLLINTSELEAEQESEIEIQARTESVASFTEEMNPIWTESIKNGRKDVLKEMDGYEFEPGTGLDDLVMERGGTPIRAWVLTTWRSGSTFLGDLLNSHPGVFHHYEPLFPLKFKRAKGGKPAQIGVSIMENLARCDYSTLYDLYRYPKWNKNNFFVKNHRLWKYCRTKGRLHPYCWEPKFLDRFCSMFPFHVAKTTRMRLNVSEPVLQDKRLNIKMIYVARDPRGTLQSRKHELWCYGKPDCEDPSKLCGDLVSDFKAAQQFIKRFPNNIRVIRYEDFSMDPMNNAQNILDYIGFTMHPKVQQFINTHTIKSLGPAQSTFRDSKTVPFAWREKYTPDEVLKIQESCSEAINLWGYNLLQKDQDLRTLEVVKNIGEWTMPA